MPGTPQRRTHHYRRHGTTNLFAALDTASGNVITSMTQRHRSEESRKFLNLIDKEVPSHLEQCTSWQTTSAPTRPPPSNAGSSHTHAPPPPPPYSSPMNLVERWFSEPATKWLRRGTHTSIKDLKNSINTWVDNPNQPTPNPSYGARPQTRYSTTPPHISTEFPKQDTSPPTSSEPAYGWRRAPPNGE